MLNEMSTGLSHVAGTVKESHTWSFYPLFRLFNIECDIEATSCTCASGSLLWPLDSHFNELCQVWICVEVALCPRARFLRDVDAHKPPPRNGGTQQAVDQISTAADVQASDRT